MPDTLIDILCLKTRGVISLIGAGGKTSLMFRLAKDLAGSGKTVLTTTTTKILKPDSHQSPHTIIARSFKELARQSASCLTRFVHVSAGSSLDRTTGKLNGFAPDIINQLWQAALFDWIIVEADGAKRKPLKATDLHEPVLPELTTHLVLVAGIDGIGKRLDDRHVHRAILFSDNTGLPMGERIDEPSVSAAVAIEMKKAARLCHPFFNMVFLNKADTPERIASAGQIGRLLRLEKGIDLIVTASLIDTNPVKACFEPEKKENPFFP